MADHQQLIDELREQLKSSTPLARAEILEKLIAAIYNHVKMAAPEGGGLDGRAGPERDGLGRLVDEARKYRERLETEGLPPNTY